MGGRNAAEYSGSAARYSRNREKSRQCGDLKGSVQVRWPTHPGLDAHSPVRAWQVIPKRQVRVWFGRGEHQRHPADDPSRFLDLWRRTRIVSWTHNRQVPGLPLGHVASPGGPTNISTIHRVAAARRYLPGTSIFFLTTPANFQTPSPKKHCPSLRGLFE